MAFKGFLTLGCFLCAVFCVSTSYILRDNLSRGLQEVHVVKRGTGVEARISALRSLQDRLRQQRLQTMRQSNYQRPRRNNPKMNPEVNHDIYGQYARASENHRQSSGNSNMSRPYPMRQVVPRQPYGEANEGLYQAQNMGRFRVPSLVRQDYRRQREEVNQSPRQDYHRQREDVYQFPRQNHPRQHEEVNQSPDLGRQRQRPSLADGSADRGHDGAGLSHNVGRQRLQNVHEQEKERPGELSSSQSEISDAQTDKGLQADQRRIFERPPSLDSDTGKEQVVVDEVEEEEAKEEQKEIGRDRYAQLQARLAQVMREKMGGASRAEPETSEMKPGKDDEEVTIDEPEKEPELDQYEKALQEEEEKQRKEEEQKRLEQEARERNEALRKRWEAQMRERRMRNLRRTG